jgi:hypothetical protein
MRAKTLSGAKKIDPKVPKTVLAIIEKLRGRDPQSPEHPIAGLSIRLTKGGIGVGRLHYGGTRRRRQIAIAMQKRRGY